MVSQSAKMPAGQLKGMQAQAGNTRYGGSRVGQHSRRSTDRVSAYQSLGASKFDTFSCNSVRPSTSFMGVSRKEAIAKHSQVPKNLFNPLTDQMTSIVGHADERVSLNPYFTQTTTAPRNCFAKDLKTLDTITADEKTLLDSLSARVRPTKSQHAIARQAQLKMPSERRKDAYEAKN